MDYFCLFVCLFRLFVCLLLLLLCDFYVRVDTVISRNMMNKIFCIKRERERERGSFLVSINCLYSFLEQLWASLSHCSPIFRKRARSFLTDFFFSWHSVSNQTLPPCLPLHTVCFFLMHALEFIRQAVSSPRALSIHWSISSVTCTIYSLNLSPWMFSVKSCFLSLCHTILSTGCMTIAALCSRAHRKHRTLQFYLQNCRKLSCNLERYIHVLRHK